MRPFAGALKFQRIGDKVLEKLPHLHRVRRDLRQRSRFDPSPFLLDRDLEIGEHLAEDFAKVALLKWLCPAGHAREL